MKHNINPKLITSVSTLALLSGPAFGGIVCTNSSPCISISAVVGNVLEFQAVQPGNKLEVLTTQTGGFQGQATYTPSPASGGSPDTGTAQFGAMDFTTTGSLTTPPPANPDASVPPALQNSPYFSAAGPESFIYQATSDSDTLAMDITWTSLLPNAPMGEPQLFGTGKITKLQGDTIFTTDFGMVGDLVSIGANFPLSGNCDLTRLSGAGLPPCTATFEMAAFEGGDATPGTTTPSPPPPPSPPPSPPPPIDAPEPMSSLVGLGIGLLGLWGTRQVMRRQRDRSRS